MTNSLIDLLMASPVERRRMLDVATILGGCAVLHSTLHLLPFQRETLEEDGQLKHYVRNRLVDIAAPHLEDRDELFSERTARPEDIPPEDRHYMHMPHHSGTFYGMEVVVMTRAQLRRVLEAAWTKGAQR